MTTPTDEERQQAVEIAQVQVKISMVRRLFENELTGAEAHMALGDHINAQVARDRAHRQLDRLFDAAEELSVLNRRQIGLDKCDQ